MDEVCLTIEQRQIDNICLEDLLCLSADQLDQAIWLRFRDQSLAYCADGRELLGALLGYLAKPVGSSNRRAFSRATLDRVDKGLEQAHIPVVFEGMFAVPHWRLTEPLTHFHNHRGTKTKDFGVCVPGTTLMR